MRALTVRSPSEGGTVDQNVGILLSQWSQGVAQHLLSSHKRNELNGCVGEVSGGRQQVEISHRGWLYCVLGGRAFEEDIVGREAYLFVSQAQSGGGVGLRIQIHHQYRLLHGGQRCPQVDRGGGFADPALLVGDGD